jgi:hypothetical protein
VPMESSVVQNGRFVTIYLIGHKLSVLDRVSKLFP